VLIMLGFGAESPRDVIDRVSLTLWRDEQGFVCLGVHVHESDHQDRTAIKRIIRIGQPTARDLGQKMIDMARDDE
jgi:hypothetical protein